MDDFEQELARMMRDTQENTPFETRHRERLQAGVRSRRRTKGALMAGGSLLLIAGVGVGLPAAFAQDHATTAPASTPTATPTPAPTGTPTSTPTATPTPLGKPGTSTGAPTGTPTGTPAAPGGSSIPTGTPTAPGGSPVTPTATPTYLQGR
ncbi:cellulase [Kitasatospora sp. NPDC059088]|uniref:cellulase n=1 Tax=Kitasatospora sp. NPDC059088 TaxID=3346722 RepID=UPI003687699D